MACPHQLIARLHQFPILKNSFYYGEFEYPEGSGNWYQGKHEPLITKELFDKVQEQLKVPIKSKWGAKQFPFKQFLKCGTCGSTIVGEEKFKKRKDGGKNRHVYYHCSRQVKYDCPEKYVKEKDIIEGLISICDQLIADITELEPGLQKAISKYENMTKVYNPDSKEAEVISNYIKYVLRNGTDFEKSRLVRNITGDLVLTNKTIQLAA